MNIRCALVCCLALLLPTQASARSETNVVYGMVSGTALLLDVHRPPPEHARGLGILFVPGSGWQAAGEYAAAGLKDMNSDWEPGNEVARAMVAALVRAGYTVFVANHRGAPGYRYPAAQLDIAQAARFLRSNDADELVPLQQAQLAEAAFSGATVPVRLLVIPGARHSENLLGPSAGWLEIMTDWFDSYLTE